MKGYCWPTSHYFVPQQKMISVLVLSKEPPPDTIPEFVSNCTTMELSDEIVREFEHDTKLARIYMDEDEQIIRREYNKLVKILKVS